MYTFTGYGGPDYIQLLGLVTSRYEGLFTFRSGVLFTSRFVGRFVIRFVGRAGVLDDWPLAVLPSLYTSRIPCRIWLGTRRAE